MHADIFLLNNQLLINSKYKHFTMIVQLLILYMFRHKCNVNLVNKVSNENALISKVLNRY